VVAGSRIPQEGVIRDPPSATTFFKRTTAVRKKRFGGQVRDTRCVTRERSRSRSFLDLDDFFDPDKGHLIGASEGEGEFNSIKFPGPNEVNGTVNCFEIAGFGGVARPFIRPLKVKPSGHIPQKRFHTDPSRHGGPTQSDF